MEFLGKMIYFDTSLVFISCLVDVVSMKVSQPMVDNWERRATNPKVIPPLESNDWDRDQYQLLPLVKIFHIPTIHKFSSDVPQVEHLQTTVSFFPWRKLLLMDFWDPHKSFLCTSGSKSAKAYPPTCITKEWLCECSCSPWKNVVMWYL